MVMETTNENARASKNQQGLTNKINRIITKQSTIIAIAGLVLLAVVWIWKSVETRNIKNHNSEKEKEMSEYTKNQIRQSHEMHLKQLAKALVWAVRTELLDNDIRQVKHYINDMVQEKNFQKITITNGKGIVIISTNKKEEGNEFVSTGDPVYLIANNTMVNNVNDSLMVLSSPIMGLNNRLGTLVITYAFQPLAFK